MPSNARYHRQASAKSIRSRLPETGRPAELMQRPVRGSGDRKKPALLTNCIASVPAKVDSVATRRAGPSYRADFPHEKRRPALRNATSPWMPRFGSQTRRWRHFQNGRGNR